MMQFDKKQLGVFTRRLRKALKDGEVFISNGVNDTDEEGVAKFGLQPGWAGALELMSNWLATKSPLNHDYTARPSEVWGLLKEAESFLKIAGR